MVWSLRQHASGNVVSHPGALLKVNTPVSVPFADRFAKILV